MVQLLVDILLQFGLHSSKKDVHKSSYKHLTNFLQVNKKFPMNFWPTSDKLITKFLWNSTNFLQSSYKVLSSLLQSSSNFLKVLTNFWWTSYKILINFLKTSYKLLKTSCELFTNFFQLITNFSWSSNRLLYTNFLITSYKCNNCTIYNSWTFINLSF